jgi:hypothetical protein
VGVGADRSGTSWWFTQITAHPEVVDPTPALKELHYFDQFWRGDFTEADIERYHDYFPRPDDSLRTGEWTPRYMYDVWTPALLHRAAPRARLLVSLRDPLERYRSHVRQILARRGSNRPFPGQALASSLSRSLYTDPLARVFGHFPRDQVLILQHERCVAEPEEQLRRTFEFLGLDDPGVVPAGLRTPVKVGEKGVGVPEHLEDGLGEAFAADARRLLAIEPGIDLGLWPGVAV